jgi:hypothetical protein
MLRGSPLLPDHPDWQTFPHHPPKKSGSGGFSQALAAGRVAIDLLVQEILATLSAIDCRYF